MEILFLHVFRAIWALRRDPGFVSLGVLAVTAILGGTAFYAVVEDLTPLDAAYLSVASLTTVGFGDITPETGIGKAFTALYVLFGYGILLALASMVATQIGRQGLLPPRLARRRAARNGGAARPGAEAPGYDVLVVGSSEAARRTALAAAAAGLRVAVLEPDDPGRGRATGEDAGDPTDATPSASF